MSLFATGCESARAATTTAVSPVIDSAKVQVVVAQIRERPFEDWASYPADLRGIEDANLAAPFQGGRVNGIKPVGSRVKAGDALCDIDSVKYEAALQAATAALQVAKGELERATINVEKGSLGRAVLDAANLGYQNARMNQASAQRAYEDCRCQAPFDGVLVSRAIEKHQTVTPGMPTMRVSRLDRLEAMVSIPEAEATGFTEGMPTEFRLVQNPDRVYTGTLASLDRAVDTRSRTIAGRIIITNNDGTLKPGMVGRASVLRHSYTNAIVVPSTALLRLQNGVAVMVAKGGIAEQKKVRVGATSADSSVITEGLAAGDMLVVTGAFQVSSGTRVKFQ
jgi:membrane fusion protein (multidrug efflux system)